jgi:hypothetical protein
MPYPLIGRKEAMKLIFPDLVVDLLMQYFEIKNKKLNYIFQTYIDVELHDDILIRENEGKKSLDFDNIMYRI